MLKIAQKLVFWAKKKEKIYIICSYFSYILVYVCTIMYSIYM